MRKDSIENRARVVINTQGHNLGLEPTDMGMILSRIPGWTTQAKGKVTRGSSEDCWFYDGQGNRVDWVQFRAHPALVALVLEGAMPSKLKCVEIPKGTEFYIKQPTEWERGDYGDNYKGEVVVQCAPYEWV